MKLTATREDLLAPRQSVIGVVERRQTLPVLANVLRAEGENNEPRARPYRRLPIQQPPPRELVSTVEYALPARGRAEAGDRRNASRNYARRRVNLGARGTFLHKGAQR